MGLHYSGKIGIFHDICWKLDISSDFSKISKIEQFSLENHWSVQDLTNFGDISHKYTKR